MSTCVANSETNLSSDVSCNNGCGNEDFWWTLSSRHYPKGGDACVDKSVEINVN